MKQRFTRGNRRGFSRVVFALLLAALGMGICPIRAAAGGAPKEVVKAKNGVVRIFCQGRDDGSEYAATGSGFYIGETDGAQYFLTNWHVVTEEESGDVCDTIYVLWQDGAVTYHYKYIGDDYYITSISIDQNRAEPCEVVFRSTGYPDYAIVKVDGTIPDLVPLPLSRARGVDSATPVYAIGYPATADELSGISQADNRSEYDNILASGPEESTLTSGVASRLTKYTYAEDTWVIQHTAHINSGNSGGPLLLSNGSVIGINTYGAMVQGNYAEYNLSIFIEYPIEKLEELGIHYSLYQDWSILILPGTVAGILAACLLLYFLYTKSRRPGNWKITPEMYRLQCVSGVFSPQRFHIQNPTRIGRDPGRNDLVYPGQTSKISGTHCQLLFVDNQLYLEDLNSTNGTFRDGIRIPVMSRVPLDVGSTFSLGDDSELFRIEVTTKKRAARKKR